MRSFYILFSLFVAAPAAAQPYVYWSDILDGTVDRVDAQTGEIASGFLSGLGNPYGITLQNDYLYWTDVVQGTIGRVRLDASDRNATLLTGLDFPYGIVTTDQHLYWATLGDGRIGRADLDGGNADPDFITGLQSPNGLAVGGGYLYWADRGPTFSDPGVIGRARLDGTGVERAFIPDAGRTSDVAVDEAYVYWTDLGGTSPGDASIGRANLNGTGVDRSFIQGPSEPTGITLAGFSIYWTDFETRTIGRAGLDGQNVEVAYITGSNRPYGIAVPEGTVVLPVELTAFTATRDGSGARLDWTTASEAASSGFAVEHAAPGQDFVRAGWVDGAGTTLETSTYRWRVEGLAPGTHRFRLRQTDLDGSEALSPVVELDVGMGAAARVAIAPNPAPGAARIGVQVERAQQARVSVFDALGREVAFLFEGTLASGEARSLPLDAARLSAGLYAVRLEGEHAQATAMLTLTR